MKKQIIIIIPIVLLFTIIIAGATYAFFRSAVNTSDLVTSSDNFEVIYAGGTEITGPINVISGEKNEDKLSTEVNIRVATGSAQPQAIIFMNIEKMTSNLSTKGYIWEVYGHKNGEQVYYNKGDFFGANDTTDKTINLVENYRLSEDNTAFTVYLWLDGNQVGNEVLGGEFKAYIGAKTENFTGDLG